MEMAKLLGCAWYLVTGLQPQVVGGFNPFEKY